VICSTSAGPSRSHNSDPKFGMTELEATDLARLRQQFSNSSHGQTHRQKDWTDFYTLLDYHWRGQSWYLQLICCMVTYDRLSRLSWLTVSDFMHFITVSYHICRPDMWWRAWFILLFYMSSLNSFNSRPTIMYQLITVAECMCTWSVKENNNLK